MSETAAAISRNVWVLGQLRGYSSKQELASAMNWSRTRLGRTLAGDRQWTLDDLETAAKVLGLKSPGELFRPLGELVNAIPTEEAAGSGVASAITGRYFSLSVPTLSAKPQAGAVVLPFRRRHTAVTQPAASEWRKIHAGA